MAIELLRSRRGGPHVSAHRGASARAPENTLAALDAAWRAGATLAEIDIRLTRDGQVVLMHDPTVNRTTTGRGDVKDLTLEDLRALDAGGWFGPEFRGEPVPTLRDVLVWAKNKLILLVELKNVPFRELPLVERTIELVDELRAAESVVLGGFDHPVLRDIKRRRPGWPLEMMYTARLADPVGAARAAGAALVSLEPEFVLPEDVRLLHEADVAVLTTLDDPGEARRLLSWGIDALESGDPAKVIAAIQAAGVER
ncbi:MAG: glycerophosphodiester phosphodiesterase [Bacillati bacterium ANGP1]|uniref:Glycerophosphodiester phosphodiesterase n=1 Tax=Candidatus Segetimicrobium genomatis TaxID=2569760 RepID=A0A537JIN6_9BACT|nr:MAG: glycerophosphodiester phosphodiesterase [Terrabacteria group bacterium ANGP1]